MRRRRDRYPDNWREISLSVKEKAGWVCQQCGVPNRVWITRHRFAPVQWELCEPDWRGNYYWNPARLVILTVHHAGVPYPDGTPGDPCNKMDNRPENLFCLCQRCHLLADLNLHMENARRTRAAKKQSQARRAGQKELKL